MATEIIVALIALVGTLGGSLGGILVSSKLANYRIEQIEKEIKELKAIFDKIANIELHLAVLEERIETLEESKK